MEDMEVKILKKTKNTMEIEVEADNLDFLQPLAMELNKNSGVEYTTLTREHPLTNKERLFIRLKEGTKSNNKDALKLAMDSIKEQLKIEWMNPS